MIVIGKSNVPLQHEANGRDGDSSSPGYSDSSTLRTCTQAFISEQYGYNDQQATVQMRDRENESCRLPLLHFRVLMPILRILALKQMGSTRTEALSATLAFFLVSLVPYHRRRGIRQMAGPTLAPSRTTAE